MFRLPVNPSTMPALSVDAGGSVNFGTARDILEDQPLGDQIDLDGEPVVDVRFDLPDQTGIPIGSAVELLFEAEASASLAFVADGSPQDVLANRLAEAMPEKGGGRFTEPFFAILDRLVMLVEGPRATQSVLQLTLHRQENGRDASITKVYA